MSKILAVFDFCDTLVNGQTVSLFIQYLYNKEPFIKKLQLKLRVLVNPYKIEDTINYKNYLLKPFSELSRIELEKLGEQFYKSVISKRFNKKILNILKEHKRMKHQIVIVSGGFDIYLKYFAKEYNAILISSTLDFKSDKFTGKLEKECLYKNKVLLFKKRIKTTKKMLKASYAYGDSISDKELLSLFGNVYVIKANQKLDWIKPNWKILEIDR